MTKVNYIENQTVIHAQNLNDIQDEIETLTLNKANKSTTVNSVTYNSNTRKLQQTINGSASDIITFGSIISFSVTEVTT